MDIRAEWQSEVGARHALALESGPENLPSLQGPQFQFQPMLFCRGLKVVVCDTRALTDFEIAAREAQYSDHGGTEQQQAGRFRHRAGT